MSAALSQGLSLTFLLSKGISYVVPDRHLLVHEPLEFSLIRWGCGKGYRGVWRESMYFGQLMASLWKALEPIG